MQNGRPILLVEGPATDTPVAKRVLDDLGISDCVLCLATTPETLTYLRTRAKQKPCVVLVSVDESDSDGLVTLRTIKADDQLRTIPVVVLGPSDDHRMVDESFELGAAGYMVKSSDYAETAATMRTLHEYWNLSELPK